MARRASSLTAMARAYIGLGSNLGDRAATLREAVRRLGLLGRIAAVSSLYTTEPVGYLEQPAFLNSAIALESALPADALLRALQVIEGDLGRTRSFPNAPRTLDLDLLLMDDLIVDSPGLTLPHPRLHERAFVLAPLAEIAPKAQHPLLGLSVAALLAALPASDGISTWAPSGWETESS